jgi:hypothetical protein
MRGPSERSPEVMGSGRRSQRQWVPHLEPMPRPLVSEAHCLGAFIAAWGKATVRAFIGGFLRPEDAFNIAVVGAQSDILR